MKLTLQPRGRAAGFTLTEVLVVIAIMTALIALLVGGFTYAQDKSKRSTTEVRIATIASALELYEDEYGSFPQPASPGQTVEIRKVTYEVSGAEMLYQALVGDGTDKILIDSSGGGTASTPSDGTLDDQEVSQVKIKDPKGLWINQESRYFMIDGWGNPMQYVRSAPSVAATPGGAVPEATTINPTTFDLWSYGNDTENTSARSVELLTNSQLKNDSVKWVKNWR